MLYKLQTRMTNQAILPGVSAFCLIMAATLELIGGASAQTYVLIAAAKRLHLAITSAHIPLASMPIMNCCCYV